MPGGLAAVLKGLSGQRQGLADLRGLLDDPTRRTKFADYLEELARHDSLRFVAKALGRSKFFAEVLQREGERLKGHGQIEAIKALDESLPSITEALDTALDRKDAELLLMFAKHVGTYLNMVSRFKEALEWYEQLMQSADHIGSRHLQMYAHLGYGRALWHLGQYCKAERSLREAKRLAVEQDDLKSISASLNELGHLAYHQGRFEEARGLYQESLAIRREIGDRYEIAASLNNLGVVAYAQGRYIEGKKHYQGSLTIFREIGDRFREASSVRNLGSIAYEQGHHAEAKELHEESLAICREIGARSAIAESLNNLGNVARCQKRFDEATNLHEESLAIRRETLDRWGIALSLNNLGSVADSQGRRGEAKKLYEKSLVIRREIGDRPGIAGSLNDLGIVARSQGRYVKAKEHYEESLAIQREIGSRWGIANSLSGLAAVSIELRRYAKAPKLLEEALKTAGDIGAQPLIITSLVVTGLLLEEIGSIEGNIHHEKWRIQGSVLLYGAQHHAEQIGHNLEPLEQAKLDEGLKKVQGKKGEGKSGKGNREQGAVKKGEGKRDEGKGKSGKGKETVAAASLPPDSSDDGLTATELEQIKAQAEAMSLDELVDYALKALAQLELPKPEKASPAACR